MRNHPRLDSRIQELEEKGDYDSMVLLLQYGIQHSDVTQDKKEDHPEKLIGAYIETVIMPMLLLLLEGLENARDVYNRTELLETLDKLEQTGHTIYFDMIWETLGHFPKRNGGMP